MRNSFKDYDGFVAAATDAKRRAVADVGPSWAILPGCYVNARVPASWVSCKVFGRTSKAPRDCKLPHARYWPTGELPTGPDYLPCNSYPASACDPRAEVANALAINHQCLTEATAEAEATAADNVVSARYTHLLRQADSCLVAAKRWMRIAAYAEVAGIVAAPVAVAA